MRASHKIKAYQDAVKSAIKVCLRGSLITATDMFINESFSKVTVDFEATATPRHHRKNTSQYVELRRRVSFDIDPEGSFLVAVGETARLLKADLDSMVEALKSEIRKAVNPSGT